MLTDMAELKLVYLVTGIYVTTPEHAQSMQKELRKAYGEPEPPAAPAPGLFGPGPFMDPLAPSFDLSPLMPPLPPALRLKREAAA